MIKPATPVLDGVRAGLRPLLPSDRDAVRSLLLEPEVARWWPADTPGHPEAEIYDGGDEWPSFGWAIVEAGSDPLIGILLVEETIEPQYRCAGIDLSLTTRAQSRGLGPEAIGLAIAWLCAERGHHRITIDPDAGNARAIRAYEKVGFEPVGVMRAYSTLPTGEHRDGLFMELIRVPPNPG